MHVICLTRRHLLPLHALTDELAQFPQLIGPEEGAPSADRDYKIRLENISPLDRQRAQPSVAAGIGHTVSTPVITHREQIERLTSQRMERMSDGKNLCAMLVTICNARLTPKQSQRDWSKS